MHPGCCLNSNYHIVQICSLIQFYPNFEVKLRESLRALVGEDVEKRVEIGLAKDGSGVGGKRHRIIRLFFMYVDVMTQLRYALSKPRNKIGRDQQKRRRMAIYDANALCSIMK